MKTIGFTYMAETGKTSPVTKGLAMKNLSLSLLFTLWAFSAHAQSHSHSHERAAVHGMVVFGTNTIYASHMPMFMSPHDHQAVFEVVPSDLATYHSIRVTAERDGSIVTIVPEPFVLTEMIAKPSSFKAQLYVGHFERGGQALGRPITFTVKQVVFSRKIPGPIMHVMNFEFGDGDERYAIHYITEAPDFDRIVHFGDGKEIYFEKDDLQ